MIRKERTYNPNFGKPPEKGKDYKCLSLSDVWRRSLWAGCASAAMGTSAILPIASLAFAEGKVLSTALEITNQDFNNDAGKIALATISISIGVFFSLKMWELSLTQSQYKELHKWMKKDGRDVCIQFNPRVELTDPIDVPLPVAINHAYEGLYRYPEHFPVEPKKCAGFVQGNGDYWVFGFN